MGNQRHYLKVGGFKEYLYVTVGEPININGYRCKVVRMATDTDDYHAGLPKHSNTSDIYIGLGPENVPRQLRLYKDRSSYKDFDWGHEHTNTNGIKFSKGTVHVQRYPGANGGDARYMTLSEHKVFDTIIRHFAPFAKLYPDD